MMTLTVVVALLALKFMVSLADQAIVESDLDRLMTLAGSGESGAERAAWFQRHAARRLATTQFFTRLCLVSATVLSMTSFDEPLWALALLLPLIFVSAELLPRGLMPTEPEPLAAALSTPLMCLHHLFWPFVWATDHFVQALERRAGGHAEGRTTTTLEDLQLLVDHESGSTDMAVGERAMISRILDFHRLTASDCMISLKDVCAVSADATVREAAAVVAREGYSRLPVFRDRLDEVVGILHHVDLLRAEGPDKPASALMRPPLFVPGTQEIDDILVILQRRAASAAVVVDEFGKTLGLLTLEDILEEIVGQIDDEFDDGERLFRPAPDGGYLIGARAPLEKLREVFGLPFEADAEMETLAGFVLGQLKHIPAIGEFIDLGGGVRLTVQRATERAVEELLLTGPVKPHGGL